MSNQGQSLKHLNTFALPVYATRVIGINSVSTLITAWHEARMADQSVLLLGEGSNVLFVEDFSGTLLLNRIKGISCTEDSGAWYLHVGAGENWHQLVCYTLQHCIRGLENLALIPGCVGAAPIQNIGAYGVELQNVCQYVDLLDLNNGVSQRLMVEDCQFGYRDSIFKHCYKEGFAIIAVGIKLTKAWIPTLSHGDLTQLDPLTVTAEEIFNQVCATRRRKLPDPAVTGNAGSFFKNPIVSRKKAMEILKKYPRVPYYIQPDHCIKLAAGWLIDSCALKGHRIGGAAVHQQQALVLININNAVSQDILDLARYVRRQVVAKFAIYLEPEVRFIAANGEINSVECVG
ncbi:UDP-N-acetylmuramate dehydrogenase [Candidatus Fukatsuia symbiotica]|uniref:UDP-N-acetylenolpyruvoylglucosamine reductase n=1 Tax=Candidatus Fukatsuia symbiotica TaxID=1878942 RepID=A0A2U8I6R5_9GAMM|nr:UDP-N-acetylmuramate dehydrogenase [Candidatus Fukatsuia symbiotica]AWK14842.1 UDP-N-acetylenolpyruvoylglucosamine reductase [Candidatus Fukatsuia symbiotica]MEA9445182.1 UDP-N-acetylmuramate dehydrogenase [Candidatus Fukatsuia symbiotica]